MKNNNRTEKDNNLVDFDDMGPDYKAALNYIVENYKIDGHKIKIQNIKVMTAGNGVKPIVLNVECGEDGPGKALVFVFGLDAEIERKKMMSQKTKEGLARVRAEGKVLGRPFGGSNSSVKLTGKEQVIQELLAQGCSKVKIAKQLNVNRQTLYKFINQRKIAAR
ncbi:MAG: helix-turn-helix domain-containing protein [Alphaproteobacteria bacterium]|nr:helix-turn-helix domain-containing protein [Alphaproteobacteria bacterium]